MMNQISSLNCVIFQFSFKNLKNKICTKCTKLIQINYNYQNYSMIFDQREHLLQSLSEFIKSLTTQHGENVEIINQVTSKEHILLSTVDLNNSKIIKNNPMPVDLYIRNVLGPAAAKNENCDWEGDMLMEFFNIFEAKTIEHLANIKNSIAKLSCEISNRKCLNFLNDFSNGMLVDQNIFITSLQNTIAYDVINSESKSIKIFRIVELLRKLNQPFEDIENGLVLELNILNSPACIIPKSFKQIDQVSINKGAGIPWTNGIDIHPSKNMYVAMGCFGGDLVIRDQNTNKEISRVKPNGDTNGHKQNCLWSPSGDKILVSTQKNHSIYIYDEAGQNLLKSIENTYFKDGYGAIWLSDMEVAIGYQDGMVKFFNIDEEKEIGSVKVINTVSGMDCLDDSHLLIGDGVGSISNIDWKNSKIEWTKTNWGSGGIICIKLNQNKTKLLIGESQKFVKLMKLEDQSLLWEFKLNHYVIGISWVPGELHVLALSYKNRLVALNSNDGTKVIEFDKLPRNTTSLRLNSMAAEVLVGNMKGKIKRLKICEDQRKQKKTNVNSQFQVSVVSVVFIVFVQQFILGCRLITQQEITLYSLLKSMNHKSKSIELDSHFEKADSLTPIFFAFSKLFLQSTNLIYFILLFDHAQG